MIDCDFSNDVCPWCDWDVREHGVTREHHRNCPSRNEDLSALLANQSPPAPTEGPGTELKATLAAKGFPTCGRCHALAAEMDIRGAQWCRDNLDALVNRMITNAALIKSEWDKRVAAHKADPKKPEPQPLRWTVHLAFNLPEAAQRLAIKKLVVEAIERAEGKAAQKK